MSDILFSLQLSLFVSTVSTIVVAIAGTVIGYFLARARFPGRNMLEAVCTLPLILPPTVVGFYLLGCFGRQGWLGKHLFELTGWSPVFTWQGAVIAAMVISIPLMVKTSKAAFESVDQSLENVSLTLGKTRLETTLEVTLPLAAKGLMAGIALSFARALGEFGATLMIAGNIPQKTQTLPLLIFQASQTGESHLVFNLVILLSLFSLIVVYLSNKWGARW